MKFGWENEITVLEDKIEELQKDVKTLIEYMRDLEPVWVKEKEKAATRKAEIAANKIRACWIGWNDEREND